MSDQDIRWKQRLSNFKKALEQLTSAVKLTEQRQLSRLEVQGLIQGFEYTHELAWQVMKDYFNWQGNPEIRGSRDAIRQAFKTGLITEGDVWMDMIKSRNMGWYSYEEDVASAIVKKILDSYYSAFCTFQETMQHAEETKVG